MPAWYASIQWFCAAFLLWVVAHRLVRRAQPATWLLPVPPALLLAFSLDEIAQLHEGFGGVLDRLVLDVPREMTPFPSTGVTVILFGIPFAVAVVLLFVRLRPLLGDAGGPFLKLVVGMAAVLVGAVGVDALSNLVVPTSTIAGIAVLVEEMLELGGATLVIWGGYDIAREIGAVSPLLPPP